MQRGHPLYYAKVDSEGFAVLSGGWEHNGGPAKIARFLFAVAGNTKSTRREPTTNCLTHAYHTKELKHNLSLKGAKLSASNLE